MYHGRFPGTHYNIGYKWGLLLHKKGKNLANPKIFEYTKQRRLFAEKCLNKYIKYFPEILDEVKGIADGNQISVEILYTLLFSMYCFEFKNKCTCFAFSTCDEIVFVRNSDFLVSIENLYMNSIYNLNNAYFFNGNTTAFVEMEDGINKHGLAVGIMCILEK